MTQTMRERLQTIVDAYVLPSGIETEAEAKWRDDLIDAILSELRVPDEAMSGIDSQAWNYAGSQAAEVFTAMIDHVRSGK